MQEQEIGKIDKFSNLWMISGVIFLLVILGSVYFLNKNLGVVGENGSTEGQKKQSTISNINSDPKYSVASTLYNQGKYKESYEKFGEILKDNNKDLYNPISQSLKLFKAAALREFDREQALKEYYSFYKDENNSLLNRAYALLSAQQNTIAFRDSKKLLFVLDPEDVKNLPSLSEREINYAISQKIYSLFPFPITAARLANYEVGNLDKKISANKIKAKEIYGKYTFGFEDNIQMMLAEDGMRHLISNSYLNLGNLMSRMEDFGIVDSKDTVEAFSSSLKYATLYSTRGTYHFALEAFLNHQVKTNNNENIDNILSILMEEKSIGGIDKNVLLDFSSEKRMADNLPYVYKKYKSDAVFKNKVLDLVK